MNFNCVKKIFQNDTCKNADLEIFLLNRKWPSVLEKTVPLERQPFDTLPDFLSGGQNHVFVGSFFKHVRVWGAFFKHVRAKSVFFRHVRAWGAFFKHVSSCSTLY